MFVCGEKAAAEAEKQQLQAEVEKLKAKNSQNNEANLRSEVVHTLFSQLRMIWLAAAGQVRWRAAMLRFREHLGLSCSRYDGLSRPNLANMVKGAPFARDRWRISKSSSVHGISATRISAAD